MRIKDIHQMPKAETDYYGKVLRILTNKTIRLRNIYRLTITPIRALVSSGKAQRDIGRNIWLSGPGFCIPSFGRLSWDTIQELIY